MSPFVEEKEGTTEEEAPGGLVAQLVANVLSEGNFDATEAQALQWLSRRHQQMCSRSRCFRKRLSIGPTIAEKAAYEIPKEVVEIREVQVNGYPYGEGRHIDLATGKLGYLWLSETWAGKSGLYTRGYSSTGVDMLALYPTPTEAGLEVAIYVTCLPEGLVVGNDAGVKIPADFYDALVAGAIATGLQRLEGRSDLAGGYEATFSAGCSELEQRINKRLRGSGAAEIRVSGINA